MKRFILGILLACALLAGAAEARDTSPFNVDLSFGWQGTYRPREWTPVEVGISTRLKKPFGGVIRLTAQQDSLSEMSVSCPIVLTPDLPLQLPLAMKFDVACDRCTAEIIDEDGRVRWRSAYNFQNYARSGGGLRGVDRNTLLIGASGRLGFGLLGFAKHAAVKSGSQIYGDLKPQVRVKLPRLLPWDWTGYASLDALILYDLDWSALNEHQSEAVVRWVSNGGRLLLILGGRPLPATHPIAKMLPFAVSGAREVTVARQTLARWGAKAPPGGAKVTTWLPPSPGPRDTSSSAGLFTSFPVGFGRVGVLGFDPARMAPERSAKVAVFWKEHLNPILGARTIEISSGSSSSNDDDDYSRYGTTSAEQAALNGVLGHLLNIKQLRPISIWWVVLLLVSLAVLLGPVDYIVLKRLGRLPLTWVTSGCYVLLFSVGAYYGVQALRGGALQVRAVSVIDAIHGQDHAWATRYSGIFASASEEFRLGGVRPKQWWSAASPEMEQYYGRRRTPAGSRRLRYAQHDGGNLAVAVPVNIWSMQCLITEEPVDAFPIRVSLKRDGGGDVLTVINQSDRPMVNAMVRLKGDRAISLGGLGPGKQVDVILSQSSRHLGTVDRWEERPTVRDDYGGIYSRHGRSGGHRAASLATGTCQRTDSIVRYLKDGAVVVCAELRGTPLPFTLAGQNVQSDTIQLVRLVVPREK